MPVQVTYFFEDRRNYRYSMFALHYATFECGTSIILGNFSALDLLLYLSQFAILLVLVGYIAVIVTLKGRTKGSVKARNRDTHLVNSFYSAFHNYKDT